jgi:lathosterol oxidase
MLWLEFVLVALALSLVLYFGLGGTLYYATYVRRCHEPERWKCQPTRFLTPALTRHAILLGTTNLLLGGLVSGSLAYRLFHGGRTALYFDFATHGLAYSVAVTVVVFVLTDAGAYWAHRMFHGPLLFRHIHKWHHRYNAPIPFTVTAMHPFEFLFYQSIFIAPMFLVPMHVASYYGLLVYIFYFTTFDHSGIKHRSWLPWQPPSQFHDDHHKYFHCNYGQNVGIWDRLHGTLRRQGRRYDEHTFGGRGAPIEGQNEDQFVEYK